MKIVRIKKSFRKYRQFWYNGMAGTIFFVTELNKDEWKTHDYSIPCVTGLKPDKTHSGYMILKRHAEIIGEL